MSMAYLHLDIQSCAKFSLSSSPSPCYVFICPIWHYLQSTWNGIVSCYLDILQVVFQFFHHKKVWYTIFMAFLVIYPKYTTVCIPDFQFFRHFLKFHTPFVHQHSHLPTYTCCILTENNPFFFFAVERYHNSWIPQIYHHHGHR